MSQSNTAGSESKIISSVRGRSDLCVGIDVHKRSYAVAIVDSHKGAVHEFAMPADVCKLPANGMASRPPASGASRR